MSEQAGMPQTHASRHPAHLFFRIQNVANPASSNGRVGMVVCCPTTTRIKGYPFEVALNGDPRSVVLADQVKNQDWRARNARSKGRITPAELAEVCAKLIALIA